MLIMVSLALFKKQMKKTQLFLTWVSLCVTRRIEVDFVNSFNALFDQ